MSDAAANAAHAKRLIEDPMLVGAFESVRAAATQAWQQTAIADVQARETAWLTVKIINRIESELQSIIDNGAIAARRVQAPVR